MLSYALSLSIDSMMEFLIDIVSVKSFINKFFSDIASSTTSLQIVRASEIVTTNTTCPVGISLKVVWTSKHFSLNLSLTFIYHLHHKIESSTIVAIFQSQQTIKLQLLLSP